MPNSKTLSPRKIEWARRAKIAWKSSSLTQNEVAKLMRLTRQAVGGMLNGKQPISFERAQEFAKLFDVELAEIVPETGAQEFTSDEQDLIEIYRRLDAPRRRRMENHAQNLLDSQEQPWRTR